jgi:hypothetical protein
MRVRFEIIGSAASHIEINFMCQDLRMEFAGFEIEGLEKKEKGTFRGSVMLSVFRILHFSKLISNAKYETPDFG